jgi:hypothetical protein
VIKAKEKIPFWKQEPPSGDDKEKLNEWKEKAYREFLKSICELNGETILGPYQKKIPFKFFVGGGNNSILVKQALKR